MKLYRACDCFSTYCKHNPAKRDVKVRDIVKASDRGYPLRCGSGEYPSAVVISVEPLVMLSREASMKWSCYEGPLETVGKVSPLTLCMMKFKRWKN